MDSVMTVCVDNGTEAGNNGTMDGDEEGARLGPVAAATSG